MSFTSKFISRHEARSSRLLVVGQESEVKRVEGGVELRGSLRPAVGPHQRIENGWSIADLHAYVDIVYAWLHGYNGGD